ncbi:MAG: C69 family dipeptidase [Chloroflexi bacterium]|nr:C69 family dipeptidase [Chloroflexota bacterium]
MCDTIVALGNATANGHVLFAKNSDREPNEAHEVILLPRKVHETGTKVKCTYIEIPQVQETYQVMLAKPFWMWGAEMGSNEFGVTIGNEAVFTRVPYGKDPGLIGMDFLRLALERSNTASSALWTMIELLEKYGQSGNCGYAHKLFYHNSFLICDHEEAWVLETAGKEWAAEKVTNIRAISNAITIDKHWDFASKNLISYAIGKGWCRGASDFSFSRCYSEPVYTQFSDARKRQVSNHTALLGIAGKISVENMMSFLRKHKDLEEDNWSPDRGITGAHVCMHAGWGPIRASQTTGSMVSDIFKNKTVHWVTGTAAPCLSIFKPIWMDCGVPDIGPAPTGIFDEKTLFWRNEVLHREILLDYPRRIQVIAAEQSQSEYEAIAKVNQNSGAFSSERSQISNECFFEAEKLIRKWLADVRAEKIRRKNRFLYRTAWRIFNQEANLDLQSGLR